MKEQRILFLDAARTYALILALGTHAIHNFGVPDLGPWIMNYPYFTSMAAPMFIFMFGVMIEIVYARRASANGFHNVDRRFLQRAYQCYLAGALISLAAWIGGIVDLPTFFGALGLVDRSRYAYILVIYAGALLLMPLILRLRVRYGIAGVASLLLIVLVAVHGISYTKDQNFGYLGVLVNRLIGVGDEYDISVLASLTFILLGMLAGRFIRHGRQLYWFCGLTGLIYLVTSLLVTGATSPAAVKTLMTEYAYGHLRKSGDILFYLMGSFYCLVTLGLIKFFVVKLTQTHSIIKVLTPLGTSSLLAFTVGNIILNLWHAVPDGYRIVPPSVAILVFFLLVWVVCRYTNKMPTHRIWLKLFSPSFNTPNTQSATSALKD